MVRLGRLIIATLLLTCCVFAAGEEKKKNIFNGVEINGGVGISGLHIVKSSSIPNIQTDKPWLNGAWISSISGWLRMRWQISPRLALRTGLGGQMRTDIQSKDANWLWINDQASGYINNASLRFKLGDLETLPVELSVGFFGFNYTRVRDFGGYLYTAGLYPMYLTSSGGGAGLAGLHLRIKVPQWLRQDLIVNFESDRRPYMDISFGYVGTLKLLNNSLEIGAGIKAHRAVKAANEDVDPDFLYATYNTVKDSNDNVLSQDTIPYSGGKAMVRFWWNPLKTFDAKSDFWGAHDLQVYSEAAILGFKDYPKPSNGVGYDDIRERIPVMVGMNLPTHPIIGNAVVPALFGAFLIAIEADTIIAHFDSLYTVVENGNERTVYDTTVERQLRSWDHRPARPFVVGGASIVAGAATMLLEKVLNKKMRLDRLTVEAEYCSSPWENIHDGDKPLPEPSSGYDQERFHYNPKVRKVTYSKTWWNYVHRWHLDDIRWSIMANKKFFDRINVGVKAASESIRLRDPGGSFININRLFTYYEWFWAVNIGVSF